MGMMVFPNIYRMETTGLGKQMVLLFLGIYFPVGQMKLRPAFFETASQN